MEERSCDLDEHPNRPRDDKVDSDAIRTMEQCQTLGTLHRNRLAGTKQAKSFSLSYSFI